MLARDEADERGDAPRLEGRVAARRRVLRQVPQRARRVGARGRVLLGHGAGDERRQLGEAAGVADGVAARLLGVGEVAQRARRVRRPLARVRAALVEQGDEARDAALVVDRVAVDGGAEGDGAEGVGGLGGDVRVGRAEQPDQLPQPRRLVDRVAALALRRQLRERRRREGCRGEARRRRVLEARRAMGERRAVLGGLVGGGIDVRVERLHEVPDREQLAHARRAVARGAHQVRHRAHRVGAARPEDLEVVVAHAAAALVDEHEELDEVLEALLLQELRLHHPVLARQPPQQLDHLGKRQEVLPQLAEERRAGGGAARADRADEEARAELEEGDGGVRAPVRHDRRGELRFGLHHLVQRLQRAHLWLQRPLKVVLHGCDEDGDDERGARERTRRELRDRARELQNELLRGVGHRGRAGGGG